MTTERRRARGSSLTTGINIDGATAPAELFDRGASYWQSNRAYAEWLGEHGLTSSLATFRAGIEGSAGNRRNYAAAAWAESAGVLLDDRSPAPCASWHKLRAAGLIS